MFIAYVAIAVLLGLACIMSGVSKLTRQERVVTPITGLGVPLSWFPALAALLITGGLGLLAGIWFAPIGVAAGVGIFLYFLGALIAHLRAHDTNVSPPVVLGLLGLAAAVLRIAA